MAYRPYPNSAPGKNVPASSPNERMIVLDALRKQRNLADYQGDSVSSSAWWTKRHASYSVTAARPSLETGSDWPSKAI